MILLCTTVALIGLILILTALTAPITRSPTLSDL